MNTARFEELLGELFDGELTPVEGDELAAALREDPARRRELRQQLVVWELWAQQHAPERSAEAFLAACRTRLNAERPDDRFVSEFERRILRRQPDAALKRIRRRQWEFPQFMVRPWRARRSLAGLAWTAAAAMVLGAVLWLALPRPAQAKTTLHGAAICTACALHETSEHLPAIRVREDGVTRTYYVRSDPRPIRQLGDYCAAPLPLAATGVTTVREGRREIRVELATREAPPAPPQRSSDERVLFPF